MHAGGAASVELCEARGARYTHAQAADGARACTGKVLKGMRVVDKIEEQAERVAQNPRLVIIKDCGEIKKKEKKAQ